MSFSILQAAAIPIRSGRICLVSSRSGKRWVVPKGCLEPGKTPAQIALQEAWEEAGLTGVLAPDPVGSFRYTKLGNNFLVTVFLLHVNEAASEWPEADRRQRIWVPEAKAGLRVENPGLRRLLRQVALGAETASECQ